MAVVDSKSKFLYVNIGAQGSNNDASVLRNSRFAKRLREGQLNIPQEEPIQVDENNVVTLPYYFIGDGGFGLQNYLITPYGGS